MVKLQVLIGVRQLHCSGRQGSDKAGIGNPIPVIAVSFLERWQSPPWMEHLLSLERLQLAICLLKQMWAVTNIYFYN